MIAILTKDTRFYDYLVGLFCEHGFPVVDSQSARLVIVDLDSESLPKPTKRVITVSSDIFEESDLTRPFLQKELIALCRERLSGACIAKGEAETRDGDEVLTLGDSSIILHGEEIALTPAEYRLLSLLYRQKPNVVSLSECEAVCRVRTERGNSVSVTVASLRKKLDYRLDRRLILSVRGVGYRLVL